MCRKISRKFLAREYFLLYCSPQIWAYCAPYSHQGHLRIQNLYMCRVFVVKYFVDHFLYKNLEHFSYQSAYRKIIYTYLQRLRREAK